MSYHRTFPSRIFAAAVWTNGDQVDINATLQGSGAYVVAKPRQHQAGIALQVLGKHADERQERSVTVTLTKAEALQLACEVLNAAEESDEAIARSRGGGHAA